MQLAADIVIIGGGLTGALVARELIARGREVLVLEAGTQAGGRTMQWGGWCTAPEECTWSDAAQRGIHWPLSYAELQTHLVRACELLNVRQGMLADEIRALSQRNFSIVAKSCAMHADGVRVLTAADLLPYNHVRCAARAVQLLFSGNRMECVKCVDVHTQTTLNVVCNQAVLCASPFATERLLEASGAREFLPAPQHLGAHVSDHLRASFVLLLPRPANDTSPPESLTRAALALRVLEGDGPQATLELRGPFPAGFLGNESLARLGLDVQRAAEWSYIALHFIGEMFPRTQAAFIDEDSVTVQRVRRAAQVWAGALSIPGARLIPINDPLEKFGIDHEAGTARMSTDPLDGVCDAYGKVWGVEGVHIADASAMPTALDRHPSLTLAALALRVVDYL